MGVTYCDIVGSESIIHFLQRRCRREKGTGWLSHPSQDGGFDDII